MQNCRLINIHSNINRTSILLSQSVIQYYKNITSLESTNLWFISDLHSIKTARCSWARRRILRSSLKEQDWKSYSWSTMLLLHKSSSAREIHYAPRFRIWICRYMACQKTTQRVCRIKPSDVYKETNVYREICHVLKSCRQVINSNKWNI